MASTVIPLRQAAVESSLKRAAFEYAGVAMLCANGAGQILALNSEASALIGGDSPVGRSVAEIVTFPSHRAFIRRWQRLWAMAASGAHASVETKLPLRGGGRLTARISVRLFRFEHEEFASIAVTETAHALADAKRIALDEMRARALAQHQSELTVVLNEDRRVVYASAALEPITGEQAFDVLGSPFEFILDQPSRMSSGAQSIAFCAISPAIGRSLRCCCARAQLSPAPAAAFRAFLPIGSTTARAWARPYRARSGTG